MAMENKNRNDKGTAAVEFALLLPLLLLMLFLMIEFSIAMYDKAVITNASREGARRGILMQDPRVTVPEITAAVTAYSGTRLISFGAAPAAPTTTVSAACLPPPDGTGDLLTVTVSYQYNFFVLPKFLTTLTGPLIFNGITVMRCE